MLAKRCSLPSAVLNELISVLGTKKQYVSYEAEQFLHKAAKVLSVLFKKQQKSNKAKNIEKYVAS